jgi:hypothetical protein
MSAPVTNGRPLLSVSLDADNLWSYMKTHGDAGWQASYADGVYRAYRVEPYFSTNAVVATDHTVRDVRDREDKTLTSPDLSAVGADNTARNVRDRNDRTSGRQLARQECLDESA